MECRSPRAPCLPSTSRPWMPLDKKNISSADGNTTRQEGCSTENLITIEAATYVVTRRFSAEKRTKQELLLSFLTQKLDEVNRVDCAEEHEI